MTVPKYDFMEGAEDAAAQSPFYDQAGVEFTLDDLTDSLQFQWWAEGESTPTVRPAVIVSSPSNVGRYVWQSPDLAGKRGKVFGQWLITAPGRYTGPTEPIEYQIGPSGP